MRRAPGARTASPPCYTRTANAHIDTLAPTLAPLSGTLTVAKPLLFVNCLCYGVRPACENWRNLAAAIVSLMDRHRLGRCTHSAISDTNSPRM